jgi:peroxiredoxin Q/BCP
MADTLEVGERAPDFEAKDQNGNSISLAAFHGRPVVLYFYPKDDTPGCTAEACSFRDSLATLGEHGVVVIGVSVDSEESHAKFASKYGLSFTLVSDKRKQIVGEYGVKGLTGMAKRITYIVGPDGIIKHVFTKVNARTHAMDVLEKLEELGLV